MIRTFVACLLAGALVPACAVSAAPARVAPAAPASPAALASPAAPAALASPAPPSTPAGRTAADFIRAFNSDDPAALLDFFTRHLSATGAKQRPAEVRASRWKEMKQDIRSLAVAQMREMQDDRAILVARTGAGDWLELAFECEPGGAGLLVGIRVEQTDGPDAGDEGPKLPLAQVLRGVSALVDSAARADEFSGVVLLAREGKPVLGRTCGLAEKRFDVPNRANTRFNLGSINKIFTQVAIGQLAEQGKLSLSDTIGKYLRDFPPEIAGRVTIQHLLDMTSGMGDFFGPEFDAMNMSRLRSLRDYFPLFVSKPLEFEPGASRRYSNAGFVTLGAIIERVTGQDYADYMRDRVWRPAGMDSTGLLESDVPEPNVAMGYTRQMPGSGPGNPPLSGSRRENIFSRPARGSSAGGGYSTAGDLLRFANALREGRLLGPAWTRWMFTGEKPDGAASAAGGAPSKGGFAFAGGAPGLNALLEIDLDSRFTLVVLSNYDPPSAQEVGRRIRKLLKRVAP